MKKCFLFNCSFEEEKQSLFPYPQSFQLAFLALFVAQRDDYIILPKEPYDFEGYLKRLEKLIPHIKEIKFSYKLAIPENYVCTPWAFSPLVAKLSKTPLDDPQVLCTMKWNNKQTLLKEAKTLTTLEELEALKAPFVLKAPFGMAGRGLRFVTDQKPIPLKWAKKILSEQGLLIYEKSDNVTKNFSTIWELKEEVSLLGFTEQMVSKQGHYQGTRIVPNLPPWITPYFDKHCDVAKEVLSHLLQEGYRGYVSCDSYLYEEHSKIHLRPICELNVRMSIGLLALKIQKNLFPKEVLTLSLEKKEDAFSLLPQKFPESQGPLSLRFCINEELLQI